MKGARTSFFSPELGRLYLAVKASGIAARQHSGLRGALDHAEERAAIDSSDGVFCVKCSRTERRELYFWVFVCVANRNPWRNEDPVLFLDVLLSFFVRIRPIL